MAQIPFDRLGVPEKYRDRVSPDAPKKFRLSIAKGGLPVQPDHLIPMLFVLAQDPDARVSAAARASLTEMPSDTALHAIGRSTHPKILEFLAEVRPNDTELMIKILRNQDTNDRTACLIAERASAEMVEQIVNNQERLLITPEIYVRLAHNPNTPALQLERAEAFLRMNRCLPEVPDAPPPSLSAPQRPAARTAAGPAAANPSGLTPEQIRARQIEAEVEAALMGLPSPTTNTHVQEQLGLEMFDLDGLDGGGDSELLGGFDFSLSDDAAFSFDLTEEPGERSAEDAAEDRVSLSQYLATLSPGQKIKLAYKGNSSVRKLLVLDRNKTVSTAVVRSGRCSEQELVAIASNRGVDTEVLREVTMIRTVMRKYPMKVALVNNPKCPVAVAVTLVNQLQRRDLEALARNRNVAGAVSGIAIRKVRQLRQGQAGKKK